MSSHVQIRPSAAQVAAFCRRWRITELALFGSVIRPDFRAAQRLPRLRAWCTRPSATERREPDRGRRGTRRQLYELTEQETGEEGQEKSV
jgi:hypothetical protein